MLYGCSGSGACPRNKTGEFTPHQMQSMAGYHADNYTQTNMIVVLKMGGT